ncbi:hypothetical protein [Geodermatophilus sabuli]|uniref:Uncharacterized protein n=1 Tax=Geodermatophilus sabuli TaxID=1564158 RepID=A0A285ECQ4_9ACTN|nr:hypothetical protein [Geodermatophilus sabuli]MBB3083381.1 hypothetical protein [Geodermatophilus sabuli]SNX96898.1 hypothetical protein SAMN06893097_105238 [Geodermatophilus sabuli]
MPIRGALARLVLGIGLVAGTGFVVVGGLALPPTGLAAVGIAAVVAGCLAGGIARESSGQDRRRTVEAAWQAAVATVVVLLVLSGTAALGGALLTLLVAGAGVTAGLAVWGMRSRTPAGQERPAEAPPAPSSPVSAMTTGELGREWVRTTAALAGPLDAAARQVIVARRQETLDELERRDPAGFARWLAAVPQPGSDPADHLRHGDPAA